MPEEETDQHALDRRGRVPEAVVHALAFCAILGIALFLRTYRLDERSVWVDEHSTIAYLDAPDLSVFFKSLRFYGLENVPLYHLLLRSWRAVCGTKDVIVLRLLSVVLSMLCLPGTYVLTRSVFGKRAALIATLCLAVSPFHARLGQTIRCTTLMVPLALLSMCTFTRAFQTNTRRWFIANAVANALMVWCHVFTAFLMATEYLFLLIFARRHWRPALFWFVLIPLITLSPLIWLVPNLAYVEEPADDFSTVLPGVHQLVADYVADDAVLLSDPFGFQNASWPFLSPAGQERFKVLHPWFDAGLILFSVACIGWAVVRLMRLRGIEEEGVGVWPGNLFLLFVVFAPLTLMLAMSVLWRPVVLTRYTAYSSFATYSLIGAAISQIPQANLRRTNLALLMALYAYQLSFLVAGTIGTDWLGAKHLLEQQMSDRDMVLVCGTHRARDVFRMNIQDANWIIRPAYTLQSVCDQSAVFLKAKEASSPDPVSSVTVWAIIEPYIFTLPPITEFERCLITKGLRFSKAFFPGMNGVYVYRVWPGEGFSPDTEVRIAASTDVVDLDRVMDDMGLGELGGARREAVLAVLRQAIDKQFPLTRYYYTILALELAYLGNLDLAEIASRRALELGPAYPFGHFARVIVLGEQGDHEVVAAALAEMVRRDSFHYFRLYAPLLEALYVDGDLEAAAALFDEADHMGLYLPHVLWERVGKLPAPLLPDSTDWALPDPAL